MRQKNRSARPNRRRKTRRNMQLESLERRHLFASLQAQVWHDADADGERQSSEQMLAGLPMDLYQTADDIIGNGDDRLVDTVPTNDVGRANFLSLSAGSYYLRAGRPTDSTFSPRNTADQDRDSDVDSEGRTRIFVLAEGEFRDDLAAGIVGTIPKTLPSAPWAIGDKAQIDEDHTGATVYVLGNDSFRTKGRYVDAVTQSEHGGTVQVSQDKQSVIYKPPANFFGTDTFTYVAGDELGRSSTATVTVVVLDVNDAPAATDDVITIDLDKIDRMVGSGALFDKLPIPVAENDSSGPDSADEPFRVTTVTAAEEYGVTVSEDGGVFIPIDKLPANGERLTFEYTIEDPYGGADTATVTLKGTRGKSGYVGGGVWHDADGDGRQSAMEKATGTVKGVLVELWHKADGDTSLTRFAYQQTNRLGRYHFSTVPPGQVHVKFHPPQGMQFTLSNVGDDVFDSDADVSKGTTEPEHLAADDQLNFDAGLTGKLPDHGFHAPLGGDGQESALAAHFDDDGNVTITGICNSPFDIDLSQLEFSPDCPRTGGSFMATYSPAGSLVAHAVFPDVTINDVTQFGDGLLATGRKGYGNLWWGLVDPSLALTAETILEGTGRADGVRVTDNPQGGASLAASCSGDVFYGDTVINCGEMPTPLIFHLDEDGNAIEHYPFEGNGYMNSITGLAVDANGNDVVQLMFHRSVDIDPSEGVQRIFGTGFDTDGAIVTIDGDMQLVDVHTFRSRGTVMGGGISVHDGQVFFTTSFNGSLVVDGQTDPVADSGDSADVLVGALRDGEFSWLRTWGGTDWDGTTDIQAGPAGVMVAGFFREHLMLMPGEDPRESQGEADGVAIHMTLDGEIIGGTRIGGDQWDTINGIALSDNGDACFVAQTQGDGIIFFDGEDEGVEYQGGGGYDGFVQCNYNESEIDVNNPPVAVDDEARVAANEALSVAATGLLANDSDPDGDEIQVMSDGGEATTLKGGRFSLQANGAYTYDPRGISGVDQLPAGSTMTDTFAYDVSDGRGGIDSGSVTVTIEGVNDPPVASEDRFERTNHWAWTRLDLLGNDSDPDIADRMRVTLSGSKSALGADVTLRDTGSIDYDPRTSPTIDAAEPGTVLEDSIEYTITDSSGLTSTTTVTFVVTVAESHKPIARTDRYEITKHQNLEANVLDNDSDVRGHLLNVVSNARSRLGATVSIDPNGTLHYDFSTSDELAAHDSGTKEDWIRYTVEDEEGNSDTALAHIIIAGAIDPMPAPDQYATHGTTPLSEGADTGLLANDWYPDTPPHARPETKLSQRGAKVTIYADGSFDYDPTDLNPGPPQQDSFDYTVETDEGGLATATATIQLTWANRNPVATDNDYEVFHGDKLFVSEPGVLTDDRDPDGDTIAVVHGQFDTDRGGRVIISQQGGFSYEFTDLDVLELAKQDRTEIKDWFDYTIQDGRGGVDTGRVQITIKPRPRRRVSALPDRYQVPQHGHHALAVLDNDTNELGRNDDLVVTEISSGIEGVAVSISEDGRAIVVTPIMPIWGHYVFAYTAALPEGPDETTEVTLDFRGYTNAANPVDVNNDGRISPLDAMIGINLLNDQGSHELSPPDEMPEHFFDTNRDGWVTPVDSLVVVNDINQNGSRPTADGEASHSRRDLIEPVHLGYGSTEAELPPAANDGESSAVGNDVEMISDEGESPAWESNAVVGTDRERWFANYGQETVELESAISWFAPSL